MCTSPVTSYPFVLASIFAFGLMGALIRFAMWPIGMMRRLSEDMDAADAALGVLVEEGRLPDKAAEELCSRLLQLNARLEELRTFYEVQAPLEKAAKYLRFPPHRALHLLSADVRKLRADIKTHQTGGSPLSFSVRGMVFSRWV
ncbi:hypothetical protein OH77DRAFT_1428994 [Trametes cingulata]|nr:hypothetical protein OH77DRAFT_1428994 [Trametes cingulata]